MTYTFTRTGPEIEAIHNTVDDLPNTISNENLIANPDFSISGSVTNPPDATPRSYSADDELFAGFKAVGALSGVTYVNGTLNGTGQLYVDIYKSEKQKDSTGNYIASIASSNGSPVESGASFVDNGDYWRVTFDMTNTFSVKLEQGSNSTSHNASPLSLGYIDLVSYGVSGIDDGDSWAKACEDSMSMKLPVFGRSGLLVKLASGSHPMPYDFKGGFTIEGDVSISSKPDYTTLMAASDSSDRTVLIESYWLTKLEIPALSTSPSDFNIFNGSAFFKGLLFVPSATSQMITSGSFRFSNCALDGCGIQNYLSGHNLSDGLTIVNAGDVSSSGVAIHSKFGGINEHPNSVIVGCTDRAIYNQHGGTCLCDDSEIGKTGNDAAANLYSGSMSIARGVFKEISGHAAVNNYGGDFQMPDCDIDTTSKSALTSESNGSIFAKGTKIRNVTGAGASTSFGGFINVSDCDIDNCTRPFFEALGGGSINAIGPDELNTSTLGPNYNTSQPNPSLRIAARSIGEGVVYLEKPTEIGLPDTAYSPSWNVMSNGNAIITTNDDFNTASVKTSGAFISDDPVIKTISSGSIDVGSESFTGSVLIETESGSATDDLINIAGGYPGMELILKINNTSRKVVAVANTGNLRLDGGTNKNMNHANTILIVRKDKNNTNWIQTAYSQPNG